MAAALIGGAFLSGFLQVLFDRLVPHSTIWDLFKVQNANGKKLLGELKPLLLAVSKGLDDAEEKEITNPHVKKWLDDLKDVVFDADDLLAEIVYECRAIADDSGFAADQFTEETKFGKKLQDIVDKISGLLEVKQHLGLEVCGREAEVHGHNLPSERQTTSLVDESEVHGREADKQAIIRLLMPEETNRTNALEVTVIVGMGGMGKTTLAQLVYGKKEVLEQFQLKAWVCVSKKTNVFLVTKNILEGFLPAFSGLESMTLDLLQNKLKDILKDKRFLLVLDDVWDEVPENWDILLKPLKHGLWGSRIIVTTRSNTVASLTSTVCAYPLMELTDDDCWSVFARCAFKDEEPSAYPGLVAIGREIVAKCGGLPLAANALGNLLRMKRDTTEWEHIMKSEIWNLEDCPILPALRLSYHYLPSSLKRCFTYCALFPKYYQFDMDELVRLWMAHGILGSREGKRPMEEIGNDYFGTLLSRSFFQRSSINSLCFVMHALHHDLAKSVAGDFYYRLEDDNPSSSPRTRHLSYLSTKFNTSPKFGGIYPNQSLQSFLPIHLSSQGRYQYLDEVVVQQLFKRSKRLRVLSLSNYINIKEIPESIADMKLLRYLDLSGTGIRRLPNVICTLWNLETLLLEDCKYLEEVPDSIVDLKFLHFLNLAGTAINQLPTSLCNLVKLCALDISETKLQEMPPKLGNLTRLQKLTDFFVGEGNSCSLIKELKELSKLKGKLRIWNLQNVQNAQVASESNLKGKQHLRDLELSWEGGVADDSLVELKVLEGLEPPCTLEHLTIRGYRGTMFPEWVGHRSFSNLVSLKIERCKNCFEMPSLGQVESLQKLEISTCDSIVIGGPSFYGSPLPATHEPPFKSLKVLHFIGMPEWETWEQHDGAFPSLQELYLSDCPKLANSLPCELPSLKKTEIKGCDQLVTPFPRALAIVEVQLGHENCKLRLDPDSGLRISGGGSGSLLSLDQILGDIQRMGAIVTHLKQVEIGCCNLACGFQGTESCSPLEGVLQLFECLDFLAIRSCPRLVSFPKCELASPTLTKIELRGLVNLKSLPEQMQHSLPSLVRLSLWTCPELESFPEGGLPSKLESLFIFECHKLMAGRMQWDLQGLPFLSSLAVGWHTFDGIESFPEAMLLPCTLTTLVMEGLGGLKSLDYRGLQHLTSLQTLQISYCQKFENLPEEPLPQSLTTVDIIGLPSLKSLSPILRHTSMRILSIGHCGEIPLVPEVALPSSITSLKLVGLEIKSLDDWGLHNLTCLGELKISGCENLESITEEALPSSLKLIELHRCPILKSIPREGFPLSLEILSIDGCPLLEEKFHWEGEEWHRISHIPFIKIDFRFLNDASEEVYKYYQSRPQQQYFGDFETTLLNIGSCVSSYQ